ncbi:MAG: sulfotransferase, partial [Leisingera sp.]
VKERKLGKGLRLLLPWLERNTGDIRVLDMAATCYFQLGDGATAVKLVEALLEAQPSVSQAWGKLAAMHMSLGNREGAAQAFETAVELNPGNVQILSAWNQLEVFAPDSPPAAQLRAVLQDEKTPERDRINAGFALARVEDKAGNIQAAFRCFSEANSLKADGYNTAYQDQRVQAQLAADSPGNLAGDTSEEPRVLFVTGLPRSGTTLVETCLTRHSQVTSIGESEALSRVAGEIRRHVASRTGDKGHWNWLANLTQEDLEHFRARFKLLAFGPAGPGEPVVIDKMPLNCFDMGLARLLLPNARFLFLSRHPLDAGLSNFTMNFGWGNRFSYGLETIGHMTRCVYQSALDYQAKLGNALRVQSYDALVRSPEEQIRAVLQHAGLGWEEACLSPEKNGNAVRTASVMQVRDSINTGALGKWKRYEAHLDPLKDALGGEAWILQWQKWDQHAAETGRFPLETA